MPLRSGAGGGSGLFGGTNSLLGKQLGSLASLASFPTPQRWDQGLTGTLMDPTQQQFGGLSKLSGPSLGFGEFDPLTGSFGGVQKIKGADIGNYGYGAGTPSTPQFGGTGQLGSLGGDVGVLNQYDQAFREAGAKYGFDPNWLKAIAATERGWEGQSVVGATGLMQIMPGGYPALEAMFPAWRTDPYQNIMLGAAILSDKVRSQGGDLGRGTMAYLGLGGADAYGTTPDAYLGRVNGYYQQLQQGGFAGGSMSQAISTMFGANAGVPDWGEFGVPSGNGLYGYGTAYGLDGSQHTGADVPLALGTAYRAPMGGQVLCGGTGIGTDSGGGSCSAFNDYYGNGAGRVEVLLDNGAVLIFGHSSTSAFRPGQRFNAGDILGTSGGMNSPHIHLEARVRDASMPSGWRIVDPRSVLGGSFGGPVLGGGGAFGGSTGGGPLAILQRLRGY